MRFTVDVEVPENAGDVTEILFAQQEKQLAAKETETNGAARLMLGKEMGDGALTFTKGVRGPGGRYAPRTRKPSVLLISPAPTLPPYASLPSETATPPTRSPRC